MAERNKSLMHFLCNGFAMYSRRNVISDYNNNRSRSEDNCFCFADFEMDTGNRRITQRGIDIQCGPRTFDLLSLLISNAGELVTRDVIRNELWKDRTVEFDQAINNCVRDARRLLGDSVKTPSYIKTIPKHGYVFICPVLMKRRSSDVIKPDWTSTRV